jgi:hypothetical protein
MEILVRDAAAFYSWQREWMRKKLKFMFSHQWRQHQPSAQNVLCVCNYCEREIFPSFTRSRALLLLAQQRALYRSARFATN